MKLTELLLFGLALAALAGGGVMLFLVDRARSATKPGSQAYGQLSAWVYVSFGVICLGGAAGLAGTGQQSGTWSWVTALPGLAVALLCLRRAWRIWPRQSA